MITQTTRMDLTAALINTRYSVVKDINEIAESAHRIKNSLTDKDTNICPIFDLSPLMNAKELVRQIDAELWSKWFEDVGLYGAMNKVERCALNRLLFSSRTPTFEEPMLGDLLNMVHKLDQDVLLAQSAVRTLGRLQYGPRFDERLGFVYRNPMKIASAKHVTGSTVSVDDQRMLNELLRVVSWIEGIYKSHRQDFGLINDSIRMKGFFDNQLITIAVADANNLLIQIKQSQTVEQINAVVDAWYSNEVVDLMPLVNLLGHAVEPTTQAAN